MSYDQARNDRLLRAMLQGTRQKSPDEAYTDDYREMQKLDPSTCDDDVMAQKLQIARARAEQLNYSEQRINDMTPAEIHQQNREQYRDQELHKVDESLVRAQIKTGRRVGSMEHLDKNEVIAQFLMEVEKT